jgi:squalene synthase HpnC
VRLSWGAGAEYSPKLVNAYQVCEQLARAHYENFPVASRLAPKAMRPHIAAIYAFARTADDFADEGDVPPNERLARLGAWRDMLHGRPPPAILLPVEAPAIFRALHHTLDRFEIEPTLCDDLLSAFEQDVTTCRYETWDAVLDYCRRSANPVGRLVLALASCRDAGALGQSDAVCTALQLTNFWQDFGRDWRDGRLYVPRDVLERHAACEDAVSADDRPDRHWQAVFGDVVARTRLLFDEGRDVSEAVRGRLRYELRATWLGGTTILDRTAELRERSFAARPTLTASDAVRLAPRAVWWRRGSRR